MNIRDPLGIPEATSTTNRSREPIHDLLLRFVATICGAFLLAQRAFAQLLVLLEHAFCELIDLFAV
jgi:hypothetical protein